MSIPRPRRDSLDDLQSISGNAGRFSVGQAKVTVRCDWMGSSGQKVDNPQSLYEDVMDWNCAPTCIGSLPHKDPEEATDLVLARLRRVPYWPQLPALGFRENMYAQYATKLPGVQIDGKRKKIMVDLEHYDPEAFYTAVLLDDLSYFTPPQESFHGLFQLLGREMPAELKALKGQVTGPVSLGLQVFDQNGKSVLYDEVYSEIVRKNLNMMARWQQQRLNERCQNTILFLDEPSLSLVGTPFAAIAREQVITWIDEVLERVDGVKGLHCCGNTDWPMVLSTSIDVLSFDAYSYGHTIALYPKEVRSFLEHGGSLSWGVVPNSEDALRLETVDSLVDKLERGMAELVAKGVDMDLLLRSSLVTPQCGLGGLDELMAVEALDLLVQVSDKMRAKHRLEG
jgi:methionine synthase II (cobalamin-independent)